jgi:L-ascorbate metabolism protein UlaG (beta-lactamase superfamily)
MMRNKWIFIHFIILAFIFPILQVQAQTPNHTQLEITYIANAGFLIEYGSKKVLIDAIHSWPNFQSTPDEVYNNLRQNKPPFDDIDLILVTHDHADHFYAKMVNYVMSRQKRAVLIAPDNAIESLKISAPEEYKKITDDQIKKVDIHVGEILDLSLDDIDLKIFGLEHDGSQSNMLNYGYLIKVYDKTLLHEGDSYISNKYFQSSNFEIDSIDILFENDPYRKDQERQKIINDYIKPKHRIAMHIQPMNLERFLKEIKDKYPDEIIFKKPMEKRAFK